VYLIEGSETGPFRHSFHALGHALYMALGLVPYSEMALAKAQYAQIVGYGDVALLTLVMYDYSELLADLAPNTRSSIERLISCAQRSTLV